MHPIEMFRSVNFLARQSTRQVRHLYKGSVVQAVTNTNERGDKAESQRMKEFHRKLGKGQDPSLRYGDFVLLETDKESGEAVADYEKNPTKWGDWQHGGRVSDF